MNENLTYLAANEDEEFPTGELTIEVTKEKSFNECLTCEYFRNGCSGPNLGATSVERVCEFLQLCRYQLRYTYQQVADLTQLSLVTVKRTLTGKNKDPGLATIQALSSVLVSDPHGKFPCAMHIVADKTEKTVSQCQRLQDIIDGMAEDHKKEIDAIEEKHKQELEDARTQNERYIKFLEDQVSFKEGQMLTKDKTLTDDYAFIRRKNRIIAALSIGLVITVLIIVGALIVDKLNSDIGFFWLEDTLSFFSGNKTGHDGIANNSVSFLNYRL